MPVIINVVNRYAILFFFSRALEAKVAVKIEAENTNENRMPLSSFALKVSITSPCSSITGHPHPSV